jgi:hypothetical protein
MKRAAREEQDSFIEEKDPEAGLVPLSAACLVASAVWLVVQMFSTDTVSTTPAGQPSPIMVPAVQQVIWESQDPITGKWTNGFSKVLPDIPQ